MIIDIEEAIEDVKHEALQLYCKMIQCLFELTLHPILMITYKMISFYA